MKERKISRRQFLHALSLTPAAVLVACSPSSPPPAESSPSQEKPISPESPADQADKLLDEIALKVKVSEPSVVAIDVTQKNKTAEEITAMAGTLTLPALAEPTPIGEAALLLLLAAAGTCAVVSKINDLPNVDFFESNDHAKEQRGEQLADLIATTVETAFSGPPDPNNKRRIYCAITKLLIENCDQAMILATELTSPSRGLTRVAALIFGHDITSGDWRHITSIYHRKHKNSSSTIEDFEKSMQNKGYTGYDIDNCPPDFPGPTSLLGAR